MSQKDKWNEGSIWQQTWIFNRLLTRETQLYEFGVRLKCQTAHDSILSLTVWSARFCHAISFPYLVCRHNSFSLDNFCGWQDLNDLNRPPVHNSKRSVLRAKLKRAECWRVNKQVDIQLFGSCFYALIIPLWWFCDVLVDGISDEWHISADGHTSFCNSTPMSTIFIWS